jgi:hypothetical protein
MPRRFCQPVTARCVSRRRSPPGRLSPNSLAADSPKLLIPALAGDWGVQSSILRPNAMTQAMMRGQMGITNGRKAYSRVIRADDVVVADTGWLEYSPADRIMAVWSLTEICLAWNSAIFSEPRLQRSVSYIQRPRR